MKNIRLKCMGMLCPIPVVSLLAILLSSGCTTIPEQSFSEEQVSMEFSTVLWSDRLGQGLDTENNKDYELYYRVGDNYEPLDFEEGSLQRSQKYSGSVDMAFYSKVIKNGVVSYKFFDKVQLDSACEKALIFVFRGFSGYRGDNCLLIDVSNLSLNNNYALFVNLAERNVEVRYDEVIEKIKNVRHSRALKDLSSNSLKPISIFAYRLYGGSFDVLGDGGGKWMRYHHQDIDFTQGEPCLLIHYNVFSPFTRNKHVIDVVRDVKLLRMN